MAEQSTSKQDTSDPPTQARSSAAKPSTPAGREEALLEQIAALAASVEKLAERSAGPPGGAGSTRGPAADADPAATAKARTAVFAYTFLGEVTGRRGEPGFRTRAVTVTRSGKGLTFTGLAGATVARVRAADGTSERLSGLREGVATASSLPGAQRIDSIVVLTSDGVPVALGPCLDPLPQIN